MKQRTLKALALTLSVTLGSLTVAAPALADGYRGGQRDHQPTHVTAGYGSDHGDRGYSDRRGNADYRHGDDRRQWHPDERRQASDRRVRHEYRESSNADYVAMAITTGVILSIFANQH